MNDKSHTAIDSPSSFDDVFLTPDQLADKLGVSRRTVANWTRMAVFPMIKIGRVCRFDYSKVIEVLKSHEKPAKRARPRKYTRRKREEADK